MDLKGKSAVVTGAGRGIGRELAKAFAARGADVGVLDLNAADVEETCRQCAALGVRARPLVASVTREDQVVAAMDAAVAGLGRLDVLVSNAGIVKDGLLVKAKDGAITGKMTLEQWQAVIDVNLTGVFLCGREAAERMIRLGHGGVIVNISSVSRWGNPGQSNYAATKAGVVAMAETWAKELARYGIRTGSVAPGYTRTDILAAMKPEMLDKLTAAIPLRRLGEVSEIARAVLFICENDFFTGRCLDVDGGMRL